jgi:hypothetical protein
LVLAAACAATEQRPVWRQRKPAIAMEYVRRVRVGQSERGSYIVTVISRIPPQLREAPEIFHASENIADTDDPFERKATATLARSLRALDGAAERAALTQHMASFDDALAEGVNANLCDAVAGFWGGDDVQRNLEFAFSWSPTRPMTLDPVRRVFLSSDRVPLIREAGRRLREREPLREFELRGPVVKLERPEGMAIGKATIVGLVDERQVRVAVCLDERQYQAAVRAHGQGQIVVTTGTLIKEGRGFALKNPGEFVTEAE